MLPFPSAYTLEVGFSLEAEISELWDTSVPVISGTCIDVVCSSLPQHRLGETISVVGHCIGPYYFIVKPNKPEQGSRLRLGLISRDFRDLGACLRHYTAN